MLPTESPSPDRLASRISALGLAGVQSGPQGLRFDDPMAEAVAAVGGSVIAPLLHLAPLRATGADTDAFLQGQLSNDIRELTSARSQLSSYSTPKGRVLALFTLLRLADGSVLLETDAGIAADTLKRLRMFVLRSKVRLDDASQAVSALGLAGTEALRLLDEWKLPVPQTPGETLPADDLVVLRRAGDHPRFSIHGPVATLAGLWQRGTALARVTPAGTMAWRLLDILAGVPSVQASTRELFVPQMLNLDAIGGISFTKGCYPGQEIVARLHYLGTAKRRMVRAVVDDGAAILPGAPLALAGGDGQSVGEVVDAAPHPAGHVVLLVVLQTIHARSESLEVGGGTTPRRLRAIQSLIDH